MCHLGIFGKNVQYLLTDGTGLLVNTSSNGRAGIPNQLRPPGKFAAFAKARGGHGERASFPRGTRDSTSKDSGRPTIGSSGCLGPSTSLQ